MRERSLAETMRQVLESERVDLHVSLPGVIRSYDAATQTADIVLGLRRVIPALDEDESDDAVEDYPILPSVPVQWPRSTGGRGYLHIPLGEGDMVWVLFCESDFNRWRETGQTSDPSLPTRHGLSGAWAIPGAHWRGNPNADAAGTMEEPAGIRLGFEGGGAAGRVRVVQNEIQVGGEEPLALGENVSAHLDQVAAMLTQIAAYINGIVPGTVTPTYITSAKATLDVSNPLPTTITRGA